MNKKKRNKPKQKPLIIPKWR